MCFGDDVSRGTVNNAVDDFVRRARMKGHVRIDPLTGEETFRFAPVSYTGPDVTAHEFPAEDYDELVQQHTGAHNDDNENDDGEDDIE